MAACSERAARARLMRAPERRRLALGALAAAGVGALLAYPHALDACLRRFGVRSVAACLLVVAVASLALRPRVVRGGLRSAWAATLGFPLLLLAATATGELVYLQLLPALVYLALACLFWASLRDGGSIIERAARLMVPAAPDFIRSYCRVVTISWGVFFAASAALIAGLALARRPEAWRSYTGGVIYALMLGLSGVEFLTRKTWFRYYYHGGPFDRLWSRLFPAESTARGRASLAHIRWYRERQAERTPGADARR